jgi:hypothetical protein
VLVLVVDPSGPPAEDDDEDEDEHDSLADRILEPGEELIPRSSE